jgi:3-hydroxyacyl-[acyl-carrier-protein] dehydratase
MPAGRFAEIELRPGDSCEKSSAVKLSFSDSLAGCRRRWHSQKSFLIKRKWFSLALHEPIVDFALFDHARPIATAYDINSCNHQRFEISQLDGILFEELETNRIVGYKDTADTDFWVRGHMPGFALMPGVIMCEAAAQLSSYFSVKNDMLGCDVIGLGGIENVRFRGSVFPGERLTIMVRGTKIRRRGMIACEFQGWVDQRLVVTGELKGVPLFEASEVLGRDKP